MLPVVIALAALPVADVSILFLGNSHTAANNLPAMVRQLIESDGSGDRATVESRFMGFLEDYAGNQEVRGQLASKKWKVVVLQGAKLSSSHKFVYPHDGAIATAKLAKESGSRVLYFAEWSRSGWAETDWILDSYAGIAKPTASEVIRVPVAWDLALKRNPRLPMWAGDGNHAQLAGSYLAALTIYFTVLGSKRTPTWRPVGIDAPTQSMFLECAKQAAKG